MTRGELMTELLQQLQAELPLDGQPVEESDILRDLPGADSIRLFRVSARLERQFGVEFEDGKLFAVRTVGDLADLLESATA